MPSRGMILPFVLVLSFGLGGCATSDPEWPESGHAVTSKDDQRLFLSLIRRLQDSGRHNAALAYLNDYRRNFPNDPEAALLTAEALLGMGRLNEAAELFTSLTDAPRTAGRAFWGLGRCYAEADRWDASIRFLERANYADPSNPKFLNDLGFAHIMVGRPDLAFHYLAQAADLSPEDDLIVTNLLLAAQRSGRVELVRDSMSRIEDTDKRAELENFVLQWQPSVVRRHRRMSEDG